MRRQRWLGRLEGSIASLVLVCLLGLGFAAATPAELYRSASATHHPTPQGSPARIQNVQMSPCGVGKDCSELDDGAVALLPRTGPQLAPLPLPQERTPANTVPEPGTLALIGAGLAGIVWRSRP